MARGEGTKAAGRLRVDNRRNIKGQFDVADLDAHVLVIIEASLRSLMQIMNRISLVLIIIPMSSLGTVLELWIPLYSISSTPFNEQGSSLLLPPYPCHVVPRCFVSPGPLTRYQVWVNRHAFGKVPLAIDSL